MDGRIKPQRKPRPQRRGARRYIYDPKNNVNTREICKTCRFREHADSATYVCTYFLQTGEMRDLNATDKHCETYKKK